MANGADGSITIDTALDNSGFERGSQKMESAVERLTDKVNQMGRDMAGAAQAYIPALQSAGRAADDVAHTMQNAGQNAQAFGDNMGSALTSSGFNKEMASAERSVSSLGSQLTRLGDAERMGLKTGAQMTRFQINVDKARSGVEALGQKMYELGNQRVNTTEYEELAKQIQKAEQALFRLYDRRDTMSDLGVDKSSREWQRLAIQIQNAEDVLARYEAEMERLHASGGATVLGSQSAQYQQMAAQFQQMVAQLQHYEQVAANFDGISDPAGRSEQALRGVDSELRQKPRDAGMASKALSAFAGTMLSAGKAALKLAGNLARVSFGTIAKGAKAAARNIAGIAKSNSQAALSSKGLIKSLTSIKTMLLGRLKRTFINQIMQGISTAIKALANYSSEFNASMSSIKNSMSGLSGNISVTLGNLVNAIAPALTTIINWISKAISYLNAFFALLSGKSFVTVAKKQTDAYADSLKGAGGAAKDLKNEVFGFDELNKESSDSGGGGGGGGGGGIEDFEDIPIMSLLPESVQDFFNRIKAAFEAGDWEGIGQIVASGLNSIIYAVDSWIDKLHPIAVTWASNIARILNGLVDGLDWYSLGSTIGNGLNTVLDTVNTFLTTFNFSALGAGLASGINGLLDRTDFSLLGQTLANKFNAVINILYGLVSGINWTALGQSVAQGMNGILSTINWSGLVATVTTGVNGIITAFRTWIASTSWAEMAQSFSENVTNLFFGIDWATMGTTLGELFNGVLTWISTVLSTVDWPNLAAQMTAGLNNFITTVNWAGIGETLSSFASGILDFLNGALQTFDWAGLGENLYQLFISIDWAGVWSRAFEYMGSLVGAAVSLLWGFIKQAWDDLVTWWHDVAYEDGEFTIQGLLNGIWAAICNIGTWIKDNIFTPFINGFKAAFGIASPSTVMEEQGGYIIEGLLQGITAAWEGIVQWVTGVVEEFAAFFSGLWDTISSAASTAWEGISSTISGVWNDLSSAASTTWNTISTTVSGVWNSLSTAASTTWNTISTTITGVWDGLSTAATQTWDAVSTKVSGVWNDLSTTASTTWESIKSTITGAWDAVSTSATTIWNDTSTFLSTTWDNVKSTASTAWEGFKTTIVGWFTGARDESKAVDWSGVGEGITTGTESGITGLWSSFKSRVVDKFKGLVNSVKSTLGINSPSKVFASIGDYMMQGLDNGVEDGSNAVMRTMSDIADALTEEMSLQPEIQAETGFSTQMGAFADKLSGAAAEFYAAAQLISSAGGLNAPAVAAGQVVPYKTRLPVTNADSALSGAVNGITENLAEQTESLDALYSLLREIRNLIERLNLTIDADSLVKAITSLQRSHVRNYGGA